jgi:hypothetical protein
MKFKIHYNKGVFKLPPSAFRLWLLLEHDSQLRQITYSELAKTVDINSATIRAAMPLIAATYRELQTVGFLPSFLVNASLSHSAAKIIAWMWVKANEEASNRVFLTDEDIASATAMSKRTVTAARQELVGRFVSTEVLTQRHTYMIRKPSQRLLNALALHAQVTQFILLNPETGNPIEEKKSEPIACGIQLTNRILTRFGLKPLQSLEDPGLRVLENNNQLFVWHTGGWSLRRHGNLKKDRGKRQIGKGNVFELYQSLAGCSPEEASKAVRYLDSTKALAKDEWIDLAKLDAEVLGSAGRGAQ